MQCRRPWGADMLLSFTEGIYIEWRMHLAPGYRAASQLSVADPYGQIEIYCEQKIETGRKGPFYMVFLAEAGSSKLPVFRS